MSSLGVAALFFHRWTASPVHCRMTKYFTSSVSKSRQTAMIPTYSPVALRRAVRYLSDLAKKSGSWVAVVSPGWYYPVTIGESS